MVSIIQWLKGIFSRKKPPVKKVVKPRVEKRKIAKVKKIKKIKPKKRLKPKPRKVKIKPKRKIAKRRIEKKIKPKIKIPKKAIKKKIGIIAPVEIIKDLIVADLMTKNPISVNINDSLSYVMRLFGDKKISGAPVIHEGNFVGVISESDIVKMIGKRDLLKKKSVGIKKLTELKVREFMHRPVYTYEYTKLSSAIDIMNKKDITRLPILDEKKKIVGILTRNDIIRGIAKELLYKILRKPRKERVRFKIDTDIDEVLRLVERKGSIDIDEVKKRLSLPDDKIEEWGKILESHDLLELFYPAIGRPKLRKKIR